MPERQVAVSIGEAGAGVFKDSKRSEKLDILLCGEMDALIRPPEEVWKEIGLFRGTCHAVNARPE